MVYADKVYKRGGFARGDGAGSGRDWRPADDGKRLDALDVVFQGDSYI